ncbi:MAG: hypothetical protein AAF802_04705 [Planctomycetota bacterium]
MKSLALLGLTTLLLLGSQCPARDPEAATKAALKFKPFFGEWAGRHKWENGSEGTVRLIVEPAFNGKFAKFTWSFTPSGYENNNEFEAMQMFVGLSGDDQRLHSMAATYEGVEKGLVKVLGKTATFKNSTTHFTGMKERHVATYVVNGNQLTFEQSAATRNRVPFRGTRKALVRVTDDADSPEAKDDPGRQN